MSLNKNLKLNKAGFTLIEIMVAVSIFSMVMLIAVGAIFSIVDANKKAQAISSVMNNLNFSVEAMVRDLRTGHSYYCGDGKSSDTDVLSCVGLGGTEIGFFSTQQNVPYGAVVSYKLDSTNCVREDGTPYGCIIKETSGTSLPMTSPDVDIKELKFYVSDAETTTTSNYKQAKILLVISGEGKSQYGNITEFNLQTLISQRRIDI
jgi:prepilin-type N-terminal cleavage/methylation domain-containing protein